MSDRYDTTKRGVKPDLLLNDEQVQSPLLLHYILFHFYIYMYIIIIPIHMCMYIYIHLFIKVRVTPSRDESQRDQRHFYPCRFKSYGDGCFSSNIFIFYQPLTQLIFRLNSQTCFRLKPCIHLVCICLEKGWK